MSSKVHCSTRARVLRYMDSGKWREVIQCHGQLFNLSDIILTQGMVDDNKYFAELLLRQQTRYFDVSPRTGIARRMKPGRRTRLQGRIAARAKVDWAMLRERYGAALCDEPTVVLADTYIIAHNDDDMRVVYCPGDDTGGYAARDAFCQEASSDDHRVHSDLNPIRVTGWNPKQCPEFVDNCDRLVGNPPYIRGNDAFWVFSGGKFEPMLQADAELVMAHIRSRY